MKRMLSESKINNIVKSVITEVVNSKVSVKNHLYKIIAPFSGPKFKDNDWRYIRQLLETIEDAGYDVSISAEDGGYRNSAGGNTLYPQMMTQPISNQRQLLANESRICYDAIERRLNTIITANGGGAL